MNILLVIDMQPGFSASRSDWMLENVSREIISAMERRDGILFLEYTRGMGVLGVEVKNRTHSCLMDLVADYRNARIAHKDEDGGGEVVMRAIDDWLHSYRGDAEEIVVTGVNKMACVRSTIEELSDLLPETKITLIGDACSNGCPPDRPSNDGYDEIASKGPNVRVLEAVGV